MDLEQLIMFTIEALNHWDFMSKKLFYFPPDPRETKELFNIDVPFYAQAYSSLELLGIPSV